MTPAWPALLWWILGPAPAVWSIYVTCTSYREAEEVHVMRHIPPLLSPTRHSYTLTCVSTRS